jgi:hypothetical protein
VEAAAREQAELDMAALRAEMEAQLAEALAAKEAEIEAIAEAARAAEAAAEAADARVREADEAASASAVDFSARIAAAAAAAAAATEAAAEERLAEAEARAERELLQAVAAERAIAAERMAAALARRESGGLVDDADSADIYDELRQSMEELAAAADLREAELTRARAEAAALRAELELAESDLQNAEEASGMTANNGDASRQWAGFHFIRDDLINLRAFTLWRRSGAPQQTPEDEMKDWKRAERSVLADVADGATDEDLFRLFRSEAAPYLMEGELRCFNGDALKLIARLVDARAASEFGPRA